MCKPNSEGKVSEVICTLKEGKAPRPDGFGPESYKKLNKMFVGPLTDIYMDSFDGKCLPPTLNLANISVILKKGKPPDTCASNRRISPISVAVSHFKNFLLGV